MKKPLTILLLFLTSLTAGCLESAKDLETEVSKGMLDKNYSIAIEAGKKLLKKEPNVDYKVHYSMAQAYAQTGDKSAALTSLEMAIKAGMKDDQAIRHDNLLSSIHDMAAYNKLMNDTFGAIETADDTIETQATITTTVESSTTVTESGKSSQGANSLQQPNKTTQKQTVIQAGDIRLVLPQAE